MFVYFYKVNPVPTNRQGILHLAGYIAYKFKKLDPSLGKLGHELARPEDTSWFIDSMNRGGLMFPSVAFRYEVQKSCEIFSQCHPLGGINKCKGVVKKFTEST